MISTYHVSLTAAELARAEWLWEGPTAPDPRRDEPAPTWDDMMERLARGELRPARDRAKAKKRGR